MEGSLILLVVIVFNLYFLYREIKEGKRLDKLMAEQTRDMLHVHTYQSIYKSHGYEMAKKYLDTLETNK